MRVLERRQKSKPKQLTPGDLTRKACPSSQLRRACILLAGAIISRLALMVPLEIEEPLDRRNDQSTWDPTIVYLGTFQWYNCTLYLKVALPI